MLVQRILSSAILILLLGCAGACDLAEDSDLGVEAAEPESEQAAAEKAGPKEPAPPLVEDEKWLAARERMVTVQIEARGIKDETVLEAMRIVPRHLFVPEENRAAAYADHPLWIGHEQTISQPYIVGFMSEALRLEGNEKVLEIGTGSGYQAAVLGQMGARVFSIEIVEPLGRRAAGVLRDLGYENVSVRIGDGYQGWPEHAPFDAIILTAAPDHVPEPLLEQLAVGGRMVLPVGDLYQELVILEKTAAGIRQRRLLPVSFVPMTGEAQRK